MPDLARAAIVALKAVHGRLTADEGPAQNHADAVVGALILGICTLMVVAEGDEPGGEGFRDLSGRLLEAISAWKTDRAGRN